MYQCKILLDSISETGKRITTFEITFPRIVLAEFNTHRMFSRNSASSRAIPFKKQIERVMNDPFIPERFPIDGKGIQPNSYIDKEHKFYVKLVEEWLECRDSAIENAKDLYAGVFGSVDNLQHIHKQLVNRLLEPFMYHTVICTATEFDNFFKLRCNENAQYEIRRIADLMYEAYHYFGDKVSEERISIDKSLEEYLNKQLIEREWAAIITQKLKVGEWHCPLVYEEDGELVSQYLYPKEKELGHLNDTELDTFVQEIKKKISVARCARVSYLTHDGKRDIKKDLELFEKLRTSGHWSPFEHVATPFIFNQEHFENELLMAGQPIRKMQMVDDFDPNLRSGNFIGWKQFRKEFPDENCVNFRKEDQ